MSKLREDISAVIGQRIEPGKWRQSLNYLDKMGAISKKVQLDMLITLCLHVEALEEKGLIDEATILTTKNKKK